MSELPWLVVLQVHCHTWLLGELGAVRVTPERGQLEATKTDFLVSPGLHLMKLFPSLTLVCIFLP